MSDAKDRALGRFRHALDDTQHADAAAYWEHERGGSPPLQDVRPTRGMVCACCGYVAGARPVVDIEANEIAYGGMTSWLSPQQAILCKVLADNWLRLVPTPEIYKALWGGTAKSLQRNGLRHMATAVRARLASLRLGLTATQGIGYRLHPISREEAEVHIARGRALRVRNRRKDQERAKKRQRHIGRNYNDHD